jgi:hypothetical protein
MSPYLPKVFLIDADLALLPWLSEVSILPLFIELPLIVPLSMDILDGYKFILEEFLKAMVFLDVDA